MRKQTVPVGRTSALVVEDLPDETLIYDLNNDKAHCLNRTAAAIWKLCDGKMTAAEIAILLEKEMRAPIDEPFVLRALEQLSRRGLLEEPFEMPAVKMALGRRQMVRALGWGAVVAVPLITSIVAPTAAHAQSACIPVGQACTQGGTPCCAGSCNFIGPGFQCN